jgi:hypothetical protein
MSFKNFRIFNFGVSVSGVHDAVTPNPLSLQLPNSEIPISLPLGPQYTVSPLTTVARGTFRRVHVTFGDVIGSHHSRLSSRLTGTWCTPMCPRPFQGNPTVRLLSDLRRRSFRRFGVSASGVRASTHLELSFAEILKLLSTLPLDPTVKFLSYDLRCRSFQNFGFRYFATCENKVLPLWFPGCRNVVRQPRVPPMDGPDEFGISRIAISTFLCNSKGFLNPAHVFQI